MGRPGNEADWKTHWNNIQFLFRTDTSFFDICSSRYFHWQLNLYCMLVMLICVIPLYIAQQLVNTIRIGECGGEGEKEGGRERDAVLTLHYCGGSCQCQTNDRMAVGASQGTGMVCCAPSGSPPNGGLMRFILDESHQKEVIMYHFCQFLPTHSVTVAHAQTVQAFTS